MIELHLNQINEPDVAPLSELLEEWGACAITLLDAGDSPILEPLPGKTPLWPTVHLSALFEQEEQAVHAELLITANFPTISN